jgi:hypothetical protein
MDSRSQVLLTEDTTPDHVPTDADSTPFTPMSDPRSAALRVLRGSPDPIEQARNTGLNRLVRLREAALRYEAHIVHGTVEVDRVHLSLPDGRRITTRCPGALATAKAVMSSKSELTQKAHVFLAELAQAIGCPADTLFLFLAGRLPRQNEEGEWELRSLRGAVARALPHSQGRNRRIAAAVRFRPSSGKSLHHYADDGELLLDFVLHGRDYDRSKHRQLSQLIKSAAECGFLPSNEQDAIHLAVEFALGNRLGSSKPHKWLSPVYGDPLNPVNWSPVGPAAMTAMQNFLDMWDTDSDTLRSDFDPAYDLRRHDPYNLECWTPED